MIHHFYPFPVVNITAVTVTVNPVNVRSTDAATELTNVIEWIVWNQSDRQ